MATVTQLRIVHDHEIIEPDVEVAIIGAGISGIGMAIYLKRAGIEDFTILERSDDIGGTWRDNTYPGVGVDIPAQAYQFSFELNPTWSRTFAKGHEVKAYLDHIVAKYEIKRHIQFNEYVRSRVFDESSNTWVLDLGDRSLRARFVISAIGAFVDPKPVNIDGLENFAGKVIHSASWDHKFSLERKRVSLIGTGASAVQILPEIANKCKSVHVYQRTPIWVGPKIDLVTPYYLRAIYKRYPDLQGIVRKFSARASEFVLIDFVVNYQKVKAISNFVTFLGRHVWYRTQVKDKALRDKLTPSYGIGCKRPSVSNSYLSTFNRDNVTLITSPISKVIETGVELENREVIESDVIVLATGFTLSSDPANYVKTPVKGRNGFDLANEYQNKRLRSYESVSIPKLPNHFMIFGPYGWTGGTWHSLVETAATHIVRVLKESQRRNAVFVEVKDEACDRWTEEMRRRIDSSLFFSNNCQSANSYYFDHHEDSPFLRPSSAKEAMKSARSFCLDDYVFETKPRR